MSRPAVSLWPAPALHALPPSPDARPLDAVTTRRAHEMVAWRGGFDASGVTVEVRGGAATLTGTVAGDRDAEEAGRLAASVRGVRDVEVRLRVERPGAPAAHLLDVSGQKPAGSRPGAISQSSFTFDGPSAA